jgi:glutamate synthase (ferredoxin)
MFVLDQMTSERKSVVTPVDLRERDACGVGFIFKSQASHEVLALALTALCSLEHRGACGADRDSGDGAGVLTDIPWNLLENEGYCVGGRQALGVAYLPSERTDLCKSVIERTLIDRGFTKVQWRTVPVDTTVLGPQARITCPQIEQFVVDAPNDWDDRTAEAHLSVVRKQVTSRCRYEHGLADFYIASLSTRTVVYKAMVRSQRLGQFYQDLVNPAFKTKWIVYHRRYSTNTLPRWALAQPFRFLGHNGEINTLLGNLNWMKAREALLSETKGNALGNDWLPIIDPQGSDSANLDDALEFLVRSGNSVESALMQLIPEAYEHQPAVSGPVKDFYEYYSALQEPWDGPAFIVFGDGFKVGAAMDRNGLRPGRYLLLADGSVILGSESGIIDIQPDHVLEKGRLGPGQMISVDIESGRVSKNWQIKERVAAQYPFGQWLEAERRHHVVQPFRKAVEMFDDDLLTYQKAFGYGKEEVDAVIAIMARNGAEPVFSMGDDTPLAVLSEKPRVLYDYFKQRFAQVTNPPIDHLREKLVTSLTVHLGNRSNRSQELKEGPVGARTLQLNSPFLREGDVDLLLNGGDPFTAEKISLVFNLESAHIDQVLSEICQKAVDSVRRGISILILSDRGILDNRASLPPLLAVGAVHHELIRQGLRLAASIVVETGQCWNVHHFACLVGFGAQAVCPYLALETVRHWSDSDEARALLLNLNLDHSHELILNHAIGSTTDMAQLNYQLAVEEGLQKVLSKMGISVLSSYIGAQIFECIGLSQQVIDRSFTGIVSRIGGLDLEGILKEQMQFHASAYPASDAKLKNYGLMNQRPQGEYHGNHPTVIRALHKALDLKNNGAAQAERQEQFAQYSKLVRERPPTALRDLLELSSDRQPIPISEVEPAKEIVHRFCTGGMSLGALSKEAHEVVAIAMNRLGGKSNSGEGGEDPLRYYPISNIRPDGTSPEFPGLKGLKSGDSAASAVRQVASARFGVTAEYLVTAKQLEIKIAQGAKPGEGGQLPGHKVSEYIARLRRAKPGIPLISPPPHHDIYSIEDLAQLIFDLRRVNPAALVSVKLVSEIGIGTVAAGVTKAHADIVQISGHDGGTGASPLSSIKNAGLPWELGLAETHQTLLANHLRKRVLLRVDGGLRSGFDIVVAALLGADEFGFGSIALVAGGCIMARICHTNNCPVGITTQKEELRKRFPGSPEPIIEFFLFLAEEVRHVLADLGYRSIADIIGRGDLLKKREDVKVSKLAKLDLGCLLKVPDCGISNWDSEPKASDRSTSGLDEEILADPHVERAIAEQGRATKSATIGNTDRTFGGRISGVIAARYGDKGFKGHLTINLTGSAGQSFGAFNVHNLRLALAGEANDYVGKGMAGGEIIIKPFEGARYRASENTIVGNTCLYGATGGALFAAGQAGERFAVRNSNAVAVVEGVGDHCCEYMTGGIVIVLGSVGRNFGAGMTGGLAYILDEQNTFETFFNPDNHKELQRVSSDKESALKALISAHYQATNSERAREVLEQWDTYLSKFWQVVPPNENDNPKWYPEYFAHEPATRPSARSEEQPGTGEAKEPLEVGIFSLDEQQAS